MLKLDLILFLVVQVELLIVSFHLAKTDGTVDALDIIVKKILLQRKEEERETDD